MPRLSIIIAAYNVENYITDCVESLKKQTFKDFEIIICDDCSTDSTKDIINELAKEDNRIRVIFNTKNLGSGPTRNRCINEAAGEFIAIQDADDISDLERLKRQFDFIEEHAGYSILGCNIKLFNLEGVWGGRRLKQIPCKDDFLFGIPFFHPTVMMRKSDVLNVGGYRQAKETRRAEDYDLFVRMYAAGMRGYNLQEPLYFYREDRDAYKKRKYKYRVDEAILRYKSFKTLGLMPKGILYIIKPLIVGLIPAKLIMQYRMKKDGGRKTHEDSDSGQL